MNEKMEKKQKRNWSNPESWKKAVGYGRRWMAETFFSGFKRLFLLIELAVGLGSTWMKARFWISALALLALWWAGARLTIWVLLAYLPRGAGQILLESLYSLAWAIALYLVMRADAAEYGLSLGTLPKRLTLVVLAGYAGIVAALFIWRIASRAMQVAHALGFYLLVVCVAPLFEELLFRGLLQTWAYRAFPGGAGRGPILSWATLVTATLFSSMHLPFLWPNATVRGWFSVGSSFVAGIILGIVRDRMGSIYPAILIHSLGNLIGF